MRRRLGEPDDHQAGVYSAAIYGSIVSTALIAVLWQEHSTPRTMTLSVVLTMLVFWLAHVWAQISGHRIQLGDGLLWHEVKHLGREEWPMVEATFAPVAVLALGWIGVLGSDNTARLALAVAIAQLFAWGVVAGRRQHENWGRAMFGGVLDGALGLVLVVLEAAVIH